MFVTSTDQRKGLLVAIVTGGRPTLKQRPVRKFLAPLADAGIDVVWSLSERDAEVYDTDEHDFAPYSREWAEEYAGRHWLLPGKPDSESFLGAFPGREWACREAERRGCWGVLQLDDNIQHLDFIKPTGHSRRFVAEHGDMALFADLLGAVTLATNARTVGGQLSAVDPSGDLRKIVRPGFPYSLFVEQVGPGREPWYGPFEDDITHSFQYGTRADGVTAAVMPFLRYAKENKSQTGMRKAYNHNRSVQLQRIFPESAKIGIRQTHSNGRGGPRIFHTMLPGSIRNRVVVQDRELFAAVKRRTYDLSVAYTDGAAAARRDKVERRAAGKGW